MDSTEETKKHIQRVRDLLRLVNFEMLSRASKHDKSKLESPEKEAFDEFTEKLRKCNYGSDEYKQFLKDLKPALDNHYKLNSHHPEHYENGINGMNLFDIIEMFFDWKAAGERHETGNIYKSIEHNKDRFNISKQLVDIFINTAKFMGYKE